jgi:rfaE bifunctional protein nucleotidyltransferase chain/domain
MEKLELIKSKIYNDYSSVELARLISYWRFKSKKIVFTNGCFDILHRGHAEYLNKAAQEGDLLVIGLNSDDSVRRLKGEKRPLQDQESRALLLASFQFISAVVIFSEDTPSELIKHICPQVLVKGGDYKIDEIIGADFVIANGGYVKTIDFVNGFSSSSIIDKF